MWSPFFVTHSPIFIYSPQIFIIHYTVCVCVNVCFRFVTQYSEASTAPKDNPPCSVQAPLVGLVFGLLITFYVSPPNCMCNKCEKMCVCACVQVCSICRWHNVGHMYWYIKDSLFYPSPAKSYATYHINICAHIYFYIVYNVYQKNIY